MKIVGEGGVVSKAAVALCDWAVVDEGNRDVIKDEGEDVAVTGITEVVVITVTDDTVTTWGLRAGGAGALEGVGRGRNVENACDVVVLLVDVLLVIALLVVKLLVVKLLKLLVVVLLRDTEDVLRVGSGLVGVVGNKEDRAAGITARGFVGGGGGVVGLSASPGLRPSSSSSPLASWTLFLRFPSSSSLSSWSFE